MPTAVINKPDAISSVVSGVAGAFKGKAQGEQYNEDMRRYDQDHEEKVREYDQDLSFRIEQLKNMNEQNQLDRNHSLGLKNLEENQANHRMKYQAMFQADESSKQRDFTGGENTKDRTLSRYQGDEQQRTTRTGNYQQFKLGRERNSQDQQRFSQDTNLPALIAANSKYMDPATGRIPPNMLDTAAEEVLVARHGGAVTGEAEITQISAQQRRQELADIKINLRPGGVDSLVKERGKAIQSDATANSMGNVAGEIAGRVAAPPPANGKTYTLTQMLQKDAEVDPHSKMLPLNFGAGSPLPPTFQSVDVEIDQMINQRLGDIYAAAMGGNDSFVPGELDKLQNDVYKKLLSTPGITDTQEGLLEYYNSAIYGGTMGAPDGESDGTVG